MKPSALVVSMLLASTAAGVAPLLPTPIKTAFLANSLGTPQGVDGGAGFSLGWPTSAKPILLSPVGHDGRFFGYLPLRNNTQCKQDLAVTTHVQGADGHELVMSPTSPTRLSIDPFTSTIYRLELPLGDASSLPATGFLEVNAKAVPVSADAKDTCKSVAVKPPIPIEIHLRERPLMGWILGVPLAISGAIVLITAFALQLSSVKLFHVMGIANWSFDKSWGANVTLGSALLVTLLGLSVFPDRPTLMSKQSYTLLQITFGGLVSLAPLVYNLLRREVEVKSNVGSRIDSQGYVIMFLLSGGLVLWAALGQIITLGILTQEFLRSGLLDTFTGRTLQGLSLFLIVLLIVYGFRSLFLTAKCVSQPAVTTGGTMPGPQPAAPDALAANAVSMTEWSIL